MPLIGADIKDGTAEDFGVEGDLCQINIVASGLLREEEQAERVEALMHDEEGHDQNRLKMQR